jgi:hypothetical protein
MEWVHQAETIQPGDFHQLRYQLGYGTAGLSNIRITCTCGVSRQLIEIFRKNDSFRQHWECQGHRPWLGDTSGKTPCGKYLFLEERGATNVYFPEVLSSIYLPNWAESVDRRTVEILEKHWEMIWVNRKIDHDRCEFLAVMYHVTADKLITAAENRLKAQKKLPKKQGTEEHYRWFEHEAIVSEQGGDNQDLFVVAQDLGRYQTIVSRYFQHVSLVHKLRETRAFVGFSRLVPGGTATTSVKRSHLARNERLDWLPATIVRGEGIFLEFRADLVDAWSRNEKVCQRTALLAKNNAIGKERRLQLPRFIMIHTFAHLLLRQLSYECGYGSSSLRERIYCNLEESSLPMNGILIYTSSGDSEGSLGGLVRQGKPGHLEGVLLDALRNAQWCSSDPICVESRGQGPDSCNLAACHDCTLVSETSCEERNRLLDRLLVVGTPSRDIGFFSEFEETLNTSPIL